MNIGIFGSTSHIAKGLIHNFGDKHKLILFNREDYSKLSKTKLDVIINCVGVGTSRRLKGDYTKYFTVLEKFDNLAIGYLLEHSDCLYISFSSGVIYKDVPDVALKLLSKTFRDKPFSRENYYGIVSLYREAKHQAFDYLNIVDLRLYSYFSRWLDMNDNYLMIDIIKAIKNKEILLTTSENIIRDFVHPQDFYQLIEKLIKIRRINDSFDVYSAGSVTKREILDHFVKKYGLRYSEIETLKEPSATGRKDIYCPTNYRAERIGYKPKYTSLETIIEESEHILNG